MVGQALHIVYRVLEGGTPCTMVQVPEAMRMFGRDRICAVVAATDAGGMWRQLLRALRDTRTVELRLDWLASDAEIVRFLGEFGARRPGGTFIATCRRRQAGGRYRGSIAKQVIYLAEALRAGCAWCDLEVETAVACPRELLDTLLGDGRRLTSAHFFRAAPPNPRRVVVQLEQTKSHAVKIAAQCDSLGESLRLLQLARVSRSRVVVPMGDAALPARVLALRQGSALAYAPVEEVTAPGQVSLDELKHVYRAGCLTRRTRVYGVIGNPVGHSFSPQLQNAGFQARRINAVHLPFLVRDLRDFLRAIEPLGIAGFSVTLPHKEAILRHLDGCDPLAAAIGAVNTVVVRAKGELYGYNTDYVGVLRALERRMPLRGSRVLILGAGGAARAVAFALAQAGAAVCICARRPERAKRLARAVGGEAVARARIRHEFFDAIVNATPVGMYPLVGQSPLSGRELNCRLVFDTIYRPQKTKLLQLTARRGIETVSGVEMFVAQGTAQWEIWTGERAPIEPMRRAVLRVLEREDRIDAAR